MVKGKVPSLQFDPATRRVSAAILPMDRRDWLAQLLTDDDVETLKHLAREGMGENTCGRSRRISPICRLGRTPPPASRCCGRRPRRSR